MAGLRKVSFGCRVIKAWECVSPDSALLAILGIWHPMQLANEWMEWAMFSFITLWHIIHC